MEFVKVQYWRNRLVFIDGQPEPAGITNTLLAVGEGRHSFRLSPPDNYSPLEQIKVIRSTSRLRPIEITFLHESQSEDA